MFIITYCNCVVEGGAGTHTFVTLYMVQCSICVCVTPSAEPSRLFPGVEEIERVLGNKRHTQEINGA